jgi:hypothetical protein
MREDLFRISARAFANLTVLRNIDCQGVGAVEFDRIDIPNPDLSARSYECVATALPIPLRDRVDG